MTVPDSRRRIEMAEAQVQHSLPGLVAAIEAEHLTRRGSMEQLRRILDRSGYCPTPESAAVLCLQLKDAFAGARFEPLTPDDILQMAPLAAPDPAPGGEPLPLAVREARRIASLLGQHVVALAGSGIHVAIADAAPWQAGFLDSEGCTSGEVVIFPWQGESQGDRYLGCLLAGAERSVYLDEALDDPAGFLDASTRHPVDAMRINAELGKLRANLGRFNELSALAAKQGRLEVALRPEAGRLELSWRGLAVLGLDLQIATREVIATNTDGAAGPSAEATSEVASIPGGGMR